VNESEDHTVSEKGGCLSLSTNIWKHVTVEDPTSQLRRGLTVLVVAALMCFHFNEGHGSELEVRGQKGCLVNLSPRDGLVRNRTYKMETASGKQVKIQVSKFRGNVARGKIKSRSKRCPKLFGETLTIGSQKLKQSVYIGANASVGQFTFRQQFVPTDPGGASEESLAQNIDGLAGLGFSGGATARFVVWSPVALDLGVGVLSSTAVGSTKLTNGEPYVVTGKFLETLIQPGIVAVRCFISRLLCRAGGTFGLPIESSLAIESSKLTTLSPLKYTRTGGDFSLGLNFSDHFSLQLGAQITQSKGEFQFPAAEEQGFDGTEITPVQVLTVFIFGGISAVF